jgi:hypothetical protein
VKVIVRVIVALLISVLAIASVTNIHTRAVQLHADGGWQTWAISTGFAVTFALFAYLLIAFKKTFFWGAAAFGAVLTSVLQTGMYLTLGADWLTSLGFGCGGPILEALLAMSEHYMDEPVKRGAPSPVWNRIGNAVAARIERGAQPGSATVAQPVAESATIAQLPQPAELRRAELLRILSDVVAPEDINKAQLGRTLNASRQQIGKDIDYLISVGRLSINGKVQVHQ